MEPFPRVTHSSSPGMSWGMAINSLESLVQKLAGETPILPAR